MHYPPHQPPQRLVDRKGFRFGCLPAMVIAWVIFLLSLFAGGDTDSKPDASAADRPPKAAASPAPDKPEPTSTDISKRRLTELSVNLVWDDYSEAQRDVLCLGIEANGPGWFAEQLESDNLDPDYAAELVTEKCESR